MIFNFTLKNPFIFGSMLWFILLSHIQTGRCNVFRRRIQNATVENVSDGDLLNQLKMKDEQVLATMDKLHALEREYQIFRSQSEIDKNNLTMKAVQLESSIAKTGALEEEKTRLQTNYDQCQKDIAAAADEKKAVEQKLADESANLNKCHEEINVVKKGEEDFKGKYNTANSQLEKLKQDNQEVQQKLQSCTEQFDAARGLKEELAKLRQDYEQLLSAYSEIQEKHNDPAFDHYIAKKMEKFYAANPGLGGAYNKTADILLPKLNDTKLASYQFLNATHVSIRTRLSPYLHERHITIVAGILLYIMIFIPLFLTAYCLTSCKGIINLRATLFFCHCYFLIVCGIAAVCAIALDTDPMTLLHSDTSGSYVVLNLMFSALYVLYILVLMIVLLRAELGGRLFLRALQLVGVCFIGALYYRMIWTPAMIDKPPVKLFANNIALPYLVPAFIYALNLYIEHSYLRKATDTANIGQTVQIQMEAVPDDIENSQSGKSD